MMGFQNFILINPVDFDVLETKFMGHGSVDTLKGIQIKNSLKEAIYLCEIITEAEP